MKLIQATYYFVNGKSLTVHVEPNPADLRWEDSNPGCTALAYSEEFSKAVAKGQPFYVTDRIFGRSFSIPIGNLLYADFCLVDVKE